MVRKAFVKHALGMKSKSGAVYSSLTSAGYPACGLLVSCLSNKGSFLNKKMASGVLIGAFFELAEELL
jgi:hypothetical protein